jgi:hypothetical protein
MCQVEIYDPHGRVSIKYRLDPNLTLFRGDVGRPFGVYPNWTPREATPPALATKQLSPGFTAEPTPEPGPEKRWAIGPHDPR